MSDGLLAERLSRLYFMIVWEAPFTFSLAYARVSASFPPPACTLYQMLDWARGKHRRYLREHPEEYKKLGRKAMVPFLI